MAESAAYGGPQGKPNLGVVKVPDPRLDVLGGIYNPARTVPAEVTFVDIPAPPEGFGKTRGISGEFLNYLQRADALLMVARSFDDPSVGHVLDRIDPLGDVETLLYELVFADLEILERRLARLDEGFKGAKAEQRQILMKEQALLARVKDGLESGAAVGAQSLTKDDSRALGGFQFLTAKPLIIVANVGEGQLSGASPLEDELSSVSAGPKSRVAAICAELEMELARMEPADEEEFRVSLELGEPGPERVIKMSHDVLELLTFFTGNRNEVRAWTITSGSTALAAAAKIHSDFERGFIRAEVVKFDDLSRCGSIAEARRQGVLRQEGKSYAVNEGDVLNILFNV